MDPKTIWTHSLRKSFRKIVRQTDLDDDTREMLMGHTIGGSREAYFDRHDIELIKKEYEKCNFAREAPESELSKLRHQLEDSKTKSLLDEAQRERILREVAELRAKVEMLMKAQ
jgi:hypothetical protein